MRMRCKYILTYWWRCRVVIKEYREEISIENIFLIFDYPGLCDCSVEVGVYVCCINKLQ